MATTKPLSDVERLEKLMKLAQQTRKFGSMHDVLSPEFRNRPRDFSELTAKLAKSAPPKLPTPESDQRMNTLYGLPVRPF